MQIVYGKNSVEAYINYAPDLIKKVYLQDGIQEKTLNEFSRRAMKQHVDWEVLRKQVFFDKVPPKVVHQGIVAEVKDFQYTEFEHILANLKKETEKQPLFLLLDQVQDPRNLGAILRSADCAGGVTAVIITKHSSSEITASAIKTSTGAALNIPIVQVKNARNAIKKLKDAGVWICSLNMDGAVSYRKQDYMMPLCLLVGGEDAGVRPIVEKESDFRVFIPMESRTVNSLNVSVATSLLLYEIAAQRNPE